MAEAWDRDRLTGRLALVGFEEAFGASATGIVRAPGRLNLIGEHIDYCGLSVLPMALQRAVWLAFSPSSDRTVRIATDVEGLEPRAFEASASIPPGPPGDWGNYVRAAVEVLAPAEPAGLRGFDAFVTSDLPVAAGLSSSSALVVATALACVASSGRDEPDPLELAALLADGERYVGTAGGGMDQAACLLGLEGHALKIDFAPLRAEPVAMPPGWRVVVAYSGEHAEKSGWAQDAYNLRTRECATAAEGVAAELGGIDPGGAGLVLYPALIERHVPDELLDVADAALTGSIRRRFRHVVGEAARVIAAIEAIRRGDLTRTGRILSASHASLREEYEVSTPALDALVETALEAGAAGARLTGAGLGGCTIALCDDSSVDAVLRAVQAFEGPSAGPKIAFVAEPSEGARVWSLGLSG